MGRPAIPREPVGATTPSFGGTPHRLVGSQAALFPDWLYHAFMTDTDNSCHPTVRSRSVPPLGHATRPRSARFEPLGLLRSFSDAGSSRLPFCLASRTRAIWQYWSVPSLSRLLST